MNWIIRFFGLKGSWRWACRQMKKGRIVRPKSATGTVRYKLDNEWQGRILWAFPPRTDINGQNAEWEDAKIFMIDLYRTDWEEV